MRKTRTRKVVLKTKRGYRAAGYSRGGLRIRLAIDTVCRMRFAGVPRSIVLTSGTDSHTTGAHPLPRAEAVDVRTNAGFGSRNAKLTFLHAVMRQLGVVTRSRQAAKGFEAFTTHYYGILEYEEQPREHIHIQVRRGHTIGLGD